MRSWQRSEKRSEAGLPLMAQSPALCQRELHKQRDGQPSIVYRKLGGTSPRHLGGRSNPQGVTFRVDCWSLTELEAAALAKAVSDLVDGTRGLHSGIFFQSVSVSDASDNPEDPVDGSDVGFFCESLDVKVFYER